MNMCHGLTCRPAYFVTLLSTSIARSKQSLTADVVIFSLLDVIVVVEAFLICFRCLMLTWIRHFFLTFHNSWHSCKHAKAALGVDKLESSLINSCPVLWTQCLDVEKGRKMIFFSSSLSLPVRKRHILQKNGMPKARPKPLQMEVSPGSFCNRPSSQLFVWEMFDQGKRSVSVVRDQDRGYQVAFGALSFAFLRCWIPCNYFSSHLIAKFDMACQDLHREPFWRLVGGHHNILESCRREIWILESKSGYLWKASAEKYVKWLSDGYVPRLYVGIIEYSSYKHLAAWTVQSCRKINYTHTLRTSYNCKTSLRNDHSQWTEFVKRKSRQWLLKKAPRRSLQLNYYNRNDSI